MIDGRNLSDQAINDSFNKYDEIRKIAAEQGDYYTTECLLDCSFFSANWVECVFKNKLTYAVFLKNLKEQF